MSTRRETEEYLNSSSVVGRRPVPVKTIIFGVAVIVIFTLYLIFRCSALYDETGLTGFKLMFEAVKNFSFSFSLNEEGVKIGCLTGAILAGAFLMLYYDKIAFSHYRSEASHGKEHFMDKKEMEDFSKRMNSPFGKPQANDYTNMIFSQNIQMSMNTDKTNLNNNVLVIGGPGSGKSWRLVKPNLLQGHGSYVVTDPSGELLKSTGKFFESKGYAVKVFNLLDMAHSDCFNPFVYANNEENVLSMIDSLIYATRDEGKSGGDPFWEDSMRALLMALAFYVKSFTPPSKQNFHTIADLLRGAEVEKDGTKGAQKKSDLDNMFESVRQKDKDHICVKYYDIFLKAGDKTAASILVTTAVKLAPFNLDAIANLTSSDDMNVDTIGDRQTVLYIIVPQGTKTSNTFLVNMLYTSIFSALYYHAANDAVACPSGSLKYHVQFVLDEFANIGVIPSFEAKLSTMRKYHMSCWIIIQATAQLKSMYDKQYDTIIGDCSTVIYLGSNEQQSMEYISKQLGKRTIRTEDKSYSSSMNKAGSTSHSYKYSELDLMSVAELRRLDTKYCIVIINGELPIYDLKFDPKTHPNFKELGDVRTGARVYYFTKCNVRPKAVSQYREKKQKAMEAAKKTALGAREIAPVNLGADTDLRQVDPQLVKKTGSYAGCHDTEPRSVGYKVATRYTAPH